MPHSHQRTTPAIESDGIDEQLSPRGADGQHLAEGRVIVNPVSGERIVIRVSGAQTGGALLVFDLYLPPGGHVPAGHVHPLQEERFTVVAGQMRFRIGRLGRRRVILARPGETVRVPVGTAHWFGNPGAQLAHARVQVRPALRMEELFEMTATIGEAEGNRFQVALARLTELACVVFEFRREVVAPHVPAFLVNALLRPIAWLGQRRGPATRPRAGSRCLCN
jgi:quercetin dioxygenase-like cupin family protein